MAANKRTADQIRRDRVEIASMYLQGRPQHEIAASLNGRAGIGYSLSRQMISYDLGQIRAVWLKATIENYDARVGRELAKIDHLERTYWAGWERSLEKHTTETSYAKVGESGQPAMDRKVFRTDPGLGDPRYLRGIEWCIERRCKLLGLDKPAQLDVTTAGEPLGRSFEDALRKVYGDGETGDSSGDDAAEPTT